MSDHHRNGLYLHKRTDKDTTLIASSPSGGYAYNWAPDGSRIGFKILIPGNGEFPLQRPVIFNVQEKKIVSLCGPVQRAGVPSFSSDGKIAYTVDQELRIADVSGETTQTFQLDNYANLAPISPDGTKVAYNDVDDRICVIHLATGEVELLTDDDNAYFNPVWSPDSSRLVISTTSGFLRTVDLSSGQIHELGAGETPSWADDSQSIFFTRVDRIEGFRLNRADICKARFDGTELAVLTEGTNTQATAARVSRKGDRLVFVTPEGDLLQAPLQSEKKGKSRPESGKANRAQRSAGNRLGPAVKLSIPGKSVKKLAGGLLEPVEEELGEPGVEGPIQSDPGEFNILAAPTTTKVGGTVPYLHQVYDTPNNFNGHWACGATSAAMCLAYTGKISYWDITVSVPYSHVSHYGRYVSQIYTNNGYTYNIGSPDPNGNIAYGGYGYIVRNNWADTKGYMRDYLNNHGSPSSVDWSPTWTELKNEVNASHPFVLLNSLTSSGHYITVVGYAVYQHTACFNDPYGNKNTPGYPSYDGAGVYYDWPGYNNGYANLNTVHCFIYSRANRPVSWAATYKAQSYPSTMVAGTTAIVWAEFTNTGTGVWKHAETFLGTSSPQDRTSPFCTSYNWSGCNRPSDVDQSAVSNGQVGRFTFIITAPSSPGTYTEKYRLVREGVTWFGPEISWTINVTPSTPPPTITAHPVAAAVCPGGTANFSVTASGSGLSYRWQKNGSNLSNGGHYSGVTTTTLTISNADANDAANYRCVVTNEGGSATSNQAALTVRPATAITAQPAAQAVCLGDTANFSVTATGYGTLSYQWQKNSVDIAGATSSTLQIADVSAEDAANYRCVVTAGCGTATSNQAALTINAETAISAQPQPQTVPAFGTANFSVTASGAGLTYRWQKNGANLSNGGNISGATSANLQISPATFADEADYRCVVTGTCGAVNSDAAALTVQAILAENFEAYAGQAAFEAVWADTGDSAYYLDTGFGNPGKSVVMPSPAGNYLGRYYYSLGAKYTGTDASPLILTFDFWLDPAGAPTWTGARHIVELRGHSGTVFGAGDVENLVAIGVYNNSNDTFASDRYQGRVVNGSNWQTLDEGSAPYRTGGWNQLKFEITTSQVKFYVNGILSETEARPNSFGFDWVVIGSDLTAAGFQAAVDNLAVSGGLPLPAFTQQPEPQSACAGSSATFTVAATGSPTLSYQWQKDGADLSDGGHYAGVNTATLQITDANSNDEADYRCRVSNADGTVTSDAAALSITGPPVITQQPANQAPCLGDNVTFTVAATGYAPLTYQWRKDGVDIGGATSATLQIPAVSAGDEGSYSCVVTDGCSNSTASSAASLTLNVAPAITGDDPREITVEKNSTCDATANRITLTASDPDSDPASLVWFIDTPPTTGIAGFVGAGTGASVTVCYVPFIDQLSADSLVVGVTDGCGGEDLVTIDVTIQACPNLLIDNFDGYVDQSDFESVWIDTLNSSYYWAATGGNPSGVLMMPSPSANYQGRYYRNLGGDFNGSDTAPLTLTFDLWLDSAGAPGWSGARHFVELRGYSDDEYGSGALENLVAIGVNNTSADAFSTLKYQGRVLYGANWQTLDEGSAPDRVGGWAQLKIEVTTSQVRFYVNGILSETEARPNSYGFDCVIVGADLTAAGFAARVDNLQVICGD